MTLSDAIVSDGSLVFVSTNDFAEVVTYKPFNYPGAVVRVNRIINVVVIRQAVSVFAEDGDTIVDGFESKPMKSTRAAVGFLSLPAMVMRQAITAF